MPALSPSPSFPLAAVAVSEQGTLATAFNRVCSDLASTAEQVSVSQLPCMQSQVQ